mgnify:CR=1 FL=1
MKLGGLLAGMGRADWQGAARTVNDMTDSAVNRESGRINQAMSKMKLAEMIEEDKKQNTFYPISVLKSMIGKDLSDETFNLMMEDMGNSRLMKNPPGVGPGITERNLNTFMTMKDNTYALNRKYLAADINSLNNERQRLEEQLKDPKLADKTGELEKIQAQLKTVNTKLIEKSNIIIGEDEKAKRIAISTQNKGWIEDFYRNPENKARSDALRQMGVGFDYAEDMFAKGMMTPQQFMEYLRHISEKLIGISGKEKESPYGKIDIEKFTPESLRKFEQTGDRADLRVRPEKPKAGDPFVKELKVERLRQGWNKQIDGAMEKDIFNKDFYESIREKGLDLIDEGKTPQKLLVKPKEELSPNKKKEDWIDRALKDPRNKGVTREQLSGWWDKNKSK